MAGLERMTTGSAVSALPYLATQVKYDQSYVDFIIDNRLVCDYDSISNTLNDYFISIGSILANSIQCNVNQLLYVDNIPNSIVIPDIS